MRKKIMLCKPYNGDTLSSWLKTTTVFMQPKLDGVRCLAYHVGGEWLLKSSTDKPITAPHIQTALRDWGNPSHIYDGELYKHGINFDTINAAVRRGDTSDLQLHIFDIKTPGDFVARHKTIKMMGAPKAGSPIHIVKTKKIKSGKEAKAFTKNAIRGGYEGVVIRNGEAPYHEGRGEIMKYKPRKTDTYKIVGSFYAKNGRLGGFIVEANDQPGEAFRVNAGAYSGMAGIDMVDDPPIGHDLVVEYQEITANGKPRFGVAVQILY